MYKAYFQTITIHNPILNIYLYHLSIFKCKMITLQIPYQQTTNFLLVKLQEYSVQDQPLLFQVSEFKIKMCFL